MKWRHFTYVFSSFFTCAAVASILLFFDTEYDHWLRLLGYPLVSQNTIQLAESGFSSSARKSHHGSTATVNIIPYRYIITNFRGLC